MGRVVRGSSNDTRRYARTHTPLPSSSPSHRNLNTSPKAQGLDAHF